MHDRFHAIPIELVNYCSSPTWHRVVKGKRVWWNNKEDDERCLQYYLLFCYFSVSVKRKKCHFCVGACFCELGRLIWGGGGVACPFWPSMTSFEFWNWKREPKGHAIIKYSILWLQPTYTVLWCLALWEPKCLKGGATNDSPRWCYSFYHMLKYPFNISASVW